MTVVLAFIEALSGFELHRRMRDAMTITQASEEVLQDPLRIPVRIDRGMQGHHRRFPGQ